MSSKKEIRDYFDLMEQNRFETDKYCNLSRYERKNIGTNGYCNCGREEEDGSVGCSIWPMCEDDDF